MRWTHEAMIDTMQKRLDRTLRALRTPGIFLLS